MRNLKGYSPRWRHLQAYGTVPIVHAVGGLRWVPASTLRGKKRQQGPVQAEKAAVQVGHMQPASQPASTGPALEPHQRSASHFVCYISAPPRPAPPRLQGHGPAFQPLREQRHRWGAAALGSACPGHTRQGQVASCSDSCRPYTLLA